VAFVHVMAIYRMHPTDAIVTLASSVPDVNLVRARESDGQGIRLILVSGCASLPCRNGGQCLGSARNCSMTSCAPLCICLPGFTGALCEQQDTSCLTLPCLNGATCVVDAISNRASCRCLSNSTGLR
jgi:hypothetical protein